MPNPIERADKIIEANKALETTDVYPAVEAARKRKLVSRNMIRNVLAGGNKDLVGIATNLDIDVYFEELDSLTRSSAILNAVDIAIPDDTSNPELLAARRLLINIAARCRAVVEA